MSAPQPGTRVRIGNTHGTVLPPTDRVRVQIDGAEIAEVPAMAVHLLDGVPVADANGALRELATEVAELKAAIADIDAHATPIGLLDNDDPDGSPHHYAVTVGALHRALGKAHTAPKCSQQYERAQALEVELVGLRGDLVAEQANNRKLRDEVYQYAKIAYGITPRPAPALPADGPAVKCAISVAREAVLEEALRGAGGLIIAASAVLGLARAGLLADVPTAAKVDEMDEMVGTIERLAAERSRYRDALLDAAADFRQRAEETITAFINGDEPEDECDSRAECHASEKQLTWRMAAQLLDAALAPASTDTQERQAEA